MAVSLRLSIATIGVMVALVSGASAFAAETIDVTLLERAGGTMGNDMGLGMPGDPSTGMFALVATQTAVKAGEVSFNVTNTSATMEHEMV